MPNFLKSLLAAGALALAASSAQATVYSNAYSNDISSFGYPDTTSYGQVFTLGSAMDLLNWSFYTSSGSAGNLDFVVANWDGSKAVGPALYTSAPYAYAGGAQTLAFDGINTGLSSGSYIAYVTIAGVGSPATDVIFAGSATDGGLGGAFRFLNSSGTDPLTLNSPWDAFYVPDMQFSAELVDSSNAVPEPGALALLAAGLIGLAALRRRMPA